MSMRNFFCAAAAVLLAISAWGQSTDYSRRYNALVERVGRSGVGVETLLENWAKAEPENPDMLQARFHYYITKSQQTEVVQRTEPKYLGLSPILALKDSTGRDVYYYELLKYDDILFAEALKVADKAISVYPARLDFRFMKANAYLSYERESPDMALSYIMGLVHDFINSKPAWKYYGTDTPEPYPVDDELFCDLMQEYCYSLYLLGTPSSYDAFYRLSKRLNECFPKNSNFIANIGSYYLVVSRDYKTALKYYDKVLKIEPDNVSVIHNALLAAKRLKNAKLEKKYNNMLAKYQSSGR